MDYHVFHFKIEPYDEAYSDVLASELCSVGFDSFETAGNMLDGYIQTNKIDFQAIDSQLSTYPIPNVQISYTYAVVPSANWNSSWEASFEPITVDGLAYIHSPSYSIKPDVKYDIVIMPRMAFGSGSHSTTRLMLRLLLSPCTPSSTSAPGLETNTDNLSGTTVLDVGCGTGILGIAALLGGSHHLTAIDIDNDSIRNTLDNLALNHLQNYDGREGDISVIPPDHTFDILLANIHLNVHLSLMSSYTAHLKSGGRLLLSGFFESEKCDLIKQAATYGLELTETLAEDEWCALSFRKTEDIHD